MSLIRRGNPRWLQVTWISSIVLRRPEEARLGADTFFGMLGSVETGQGAQTSDISASASTPAAFAQTGQGSQTSDIVGDVVSSAAIQTGQGSQTSDVVATTPFVAAVETGQGGQTTDAVCDLTSFQFIAPTGWWDAANVTTYPGTSLWKGSPRVGRVSITAMLAGADSSGALAAVSADAEFTDIPVVLYADGVGSHGVDFGSRRITGAGGDAYQLFGDATVYNLTQYAIIPGIGSEEAFGATKVITLDQNVSTTGLRDDAFGTPSLENANRTIFPQRIDPTLAFGAAEVIGPRYISGAAITYDGAIGDHEVIGPRIVYPSGAASEEAFGTTYVAFSTRDVRPSSIQKPSNQVPAVLIGNAARDMDIYGIGNEDVGMGDPIIGEPPFDVIWGAGVGDASEFGEADVDLTGATRRIRPGWPINNPSIRTLFGTAKIIPHTIHPTNVNTPAYGRPTVSNWIRYIDLSVGEKGIAGSRYGNLWISNWIRYIEPAGFDHSEVWWPFGPVPAGQSAAVRHVSDGKLYPGSINDGAFGDASVRINLC